MKLKNLFIVRHALHFETHHKGINPDGIGQMKAFAHFVRSIIGENNNIKILSSNKLRCDHSAQVIEETLGISHRGIKYDDILYSSDVAKPQLKEALDLINQEADEVVIVVTHLEYTRDLPSHFGTHVLNTTTFPVCKLEKGEAWAINCELVEIQKFTPPKQYAA